MLKITIQNYQTKEKTLYQDFDFEFPDHELFCFFALMEAEKQPS